MWVAGPDERRAVDQCVAQEERRWPVACEWCEGGEGGGTGGNSDADMKMPNGKAVEGREEAPSAMLPDTDVKGKENEGATERQLRVDEMCGGGASSREGSCCATRSGGTIIPPALCAFPVSHRQLICSTWQRTC